MITIIAGSRNITDYAQLLLAVKASKFDITAVVSGCAAGVDTLAIRYANEQKLILHRYEAEWNKYGKIAGNVRNGRMAQFADQLIAIWDGRSRGTADMINKAQALNLKVFIWRQQSVQPIN